jgi:hypothetical protein
VGNREENLRVLTEHINELAGRQLDAVDKLTGANRAAGAASSTVAATHGVICLMTTQALAEADTARTDAGATLARVSAELAQKLENAARNYQSTDYLSGDKIGGECRV